MKMRTFRSPHHKLWKKGIVLLLIGNMATFLFTGCESDSFGDKDSVYVEEVSEESTDTTEEVALTFLGFKADAMNLTAIETALQGYMNQNPSVRISYEGIKGSAYWEVFDVRADRNEMDNIVMVHHDDVVKLRKEGKLADLSDLETISNFSAMAQSQFIEEDGSVYFLPTQISTFNLYINEELLEAYHLEIPTNWSEFAAVCDFFVEQGIVPIIGNNFTTWRSLIAAKGLYPVYQMEHPEEMIEKFNSGEVDIVDYLADGVTMVGEMLDRGWFDREEALVTGATSDDLDLFAQGDRPFLITGGWASQRLKEKGADFTYGIYPFPILEDGSVLVMNVDTCISVSAQADNLAVAKDFVAYFTQPDVIFNFCDSQSSYAPLNDERAPSDTTIAPSVPYLFNGQSVIGSDYRLNLPLDSAENEVGVAMLQGMDTQQAIEMLSEQLKQDGSG
jgi:raffinose/stachyose/melibiose transport system substrate-binding protein